MLKDQGLTLHQIEYRKTSEGEYLKRTEESLKKQGINPARIISKWSELNDEQKEFMLRKNILNISLEHLQGLGFKPYTSYRLDAEEFLTIALSK